MSTLSLSLLDSVSLSEDRKRRSTSSLTFIHSADRFFIQPMNLCEPSEDLLGYTQVCSLKLDEIDDLQDSNLNQARLSPAETQVVASFIVRLWSRSSGRYLCILPVGASVYARGVFGPAGQFRMLVKDSGQVMFQSTTNAEQHIAIDGYRIAGHGTGGDACDFLASQNDDGYCMFESAHRQGLYLGVRENGNIMPANQVSPDSTHAHFIIQKEAVDIL